VLAVLLVLGLVVGAICGVVAFYQWTLTKRLRAHRKVIDFVGGALRKHDRQVDALECQVGRATARLDNLTERLVAAEQSLSLMPPPEDRNRDILTGGRSTVEEMGARTVEDATSLWTRIMNNEED
jgi:hypothetical protein